MRIDWSKVRRNIAVIAMLSLSQTLFATVIDFESVEVGGCQVSRGGIVDGFELGKYDGDSAGGFNLASNCKTIAPTAHSGDKYMLNFNSLTAEFTRQVGTFTLNSLFVYADNRARVATVRFQGLDGINGNVLYSLDVDITNTWRQVIFDGWFGVKTFTWDSLVPHSSNIAIDDFEYSIVSSIPEPAAFLFILLGSIFILRLIVNQTV